MTRTITFIFDVETDGDLNDSPAEFPGALKGDVVRSVVLDRSATVHYQCAHVANDGFVTLTVAQGPNGFDREVTATIEI